jgi:ABC-2 type transport system permease protein
MWRTYRRNLSAAVGAILALLFLLPLSTMIAIGCFLGFRFLEPPMAAHLLRAVLLAAYLLWLLSPLFGYELTEEYDISKLFLYPMSSRLITAGALLGSLLDLGFLLLIPTLLVILAAFSASIAAFLIVLVALLLFVFHTVALSQSISLASAGILRSRRARDVMVVLIPLLMTLFYLGSQILPYRLRHANWSVVLDSRAWDIVSYLPFGLAARAISGARQGDIVQSVAFLLALSGIAVATLYLSSWLVRLVYAGEVVSAPLRRRTAPRAASSPRLRPADAGATPTRIRWSGLGLPPVIEAVIEKELKYLRRDPFFKASLMMAIYMLVVIIILLVSPRTARPQAMRDLAQVIVCGASSMLLFAEAQLAFNIFGNDGAAAAMLFLFPSPRQHIIIGKNAALFVALSGVNLVFALVLTALGKRLQLLPEVFLWFVLATVMLISCGNLISLWFPVRIVMRGWTVRRHSASRGLLHGVIYAGVSGIAALLSLPVLAAVLLPTYWLEPVWFALTIPLSLAYVCVAYLASLRLAAAGLGLREAEIANALRQER